jgi:hypothetical protein
VARIAFGLTLSIGGATAWLALDEFRYLAFYRNELLRSYGWIIMAYVSALSFDLFAVLYLACRRLGLGDAGRKLRRLDREVRQGKTFDAELARRLRQQEEGRA